MEKHDQGSDSLAPLDPIPHFWIRVECTPVEAYHLLPPRAQGLFFAVLAARACALGTAQAIGRTRREQKLILAFLDETTGKTLSQLLTYPPDIGVGTARKTLECISDLPEYFSTVIKPGLPIEFDDDDEEDRQT